MSFGGQRSSPVVIAGGGISGLAAAVALRQHGIAGTVLERRDEILGGGLGLNLPGNAVVALQTLGLGQELERVGTPTRRREYRNERGRLLFAVDEVAFWGADAQPRCVLRGDLLDALRRQLPNDTVRLGAEVRDVRFTGPRVEATLAGDEIVSGDVLIGADGVHSTVRGQVSDVGAPRTAVLSSASWRFVTRNLGIDCWTAWTGASGTALLIPVGPGRVYGWLGGRGDDQDDFGQAAAAFRRYPRLVHDTLTLAGAEPVPPFRSPLEEIRPPAYPAGRAVLIGDAAHATAPVWAQGVGLAVEDAVALADVLARDAWADAGAELARRRRDRVRHVQRMTDRMSRTARLPTWLLDLLAPRVGPRSYRQTYEPLRTTQRR